MRMISPLCCVALFTSLHVFSVPLSMKQHINSFSIP